MIKSSESDSGAASWHIASRWQEYDGELRSAVLRAILVVVYYSIQLTHHLMLNPIVEAERIFHRQVTMIVVAWLFLSLAVFISLKGGFMPPILKYISTAIDLALVIVLAWFGNGTSSPLLMALFLVLALAAMRFRIGLVGFATVGAMTGYMCLVGATDKIWFDADHHTPILTQSITLCSLASTGIVLGQIVRSSRTMADAYLARSDRELGKLNS